MSLEKVKLINWLNLYSVSVGEEFTLASGQKSNIYVDVKKTALHHQGCKLLASLLTATMVKEFSPIFAVAGVVLGGCHLASIVAMQYPIGLDVIFVRKEVKDHGTQKLIERPYTVIAGQEIILLEDVITTGKSAIEAADLLEKEGLTVKGIIAVVDRRPILTSYLGKYKVVSLVKMEELTV